MIQQDQSVQFYDKYPQPNDANRYSELIQKEKMQHRINYFKKCLRIGDNYKRILCVGCGTGEELQAIEKLYPNAIIEGLEPAEAQYLYAKKKGFVVHNDTIERFFPEYKYDLIVCSGVLHHTLNPPKNLRRMSRWLNMNGHIFLGVYHHGRWETAGIDSHRPGDAGWADVTINPQERTYSWEGALSLIEGAGLKPIMNGHPLPQPQGRLWMLVYDFLFLWKRQQMLVILCQKK